MGESAQSLLMHQALAVLSVASGPMMIALLVVGLAVGILQAATQINDPAVGFLPRVAAALGVVWLAGPWMMQHLAGFFVSAVNAMAGR